MDVRWSVEARCRVGSAWAVAIDGIEYWTAGTEESLAVFVRNDELGSVNAVVLLV